RPLRGVGEGPRGGEGCAGAAEEWPAASWSSARHHAERKRTHMILAAAGPWTPVTLSTNVSGTPSGAFVGDGFLVLVASPSAAEIQVLHVGLDGSVSPRAAIPIAVVSTSPRPRPRSAGTPSRDGSAR